MIQRRDLALSLAGWACLPVASNVGGCAPSTAAPEVSYTLLDGSSRLFSAGLGKVRLLNFWATTCSICVQEMPEFVGLNREFASPRFELLAIAMNYDAPARVDEFARERRLPFGVVIDLSGAVAEAFGPVNATPTSLLVDSHGTIVWRHVGRPDFPALHARIASLLAAA
jgi:peroxiredoxin